jgi:hypothetical protein
VFADKATKTPSIGRLVGTRGFGAGRGVILIHSLPSSGLSRRYKTHFEVRTDVK